jgi:hypothetical protein
MKEKSFSRAVSVYYNSETAVIAFPYLQEIAPTFQKE